MQNTLQMESTSSLFKNPSNPNISVNQFGISVFGILDVKTTIIKPQEEEYIDFTKTEEETEVTDYSREFDDTNWISLNEETTNSNYKTLNNYFMNRTISDKNEYTGLFSNKNLIVIMMESVDEIFINPEYYPTFYKLYTEGWSFTNSYSPRNSCSTGNNEMSGMISLYSIYRTCTANNYKNNEYFESIFNLFNNAGYKTSSFHDYTEKYYYRSTIHKNMGSGAYYGVSDLGIAYDAAYEEWPSDVLLMEEAMKRIDTSSPFMAWITTVTSHQPYYTSSEMGDKYLSLFSDTNYSTSLKRYMSKLKELDYALERLLNLLEEEGVLDDTVIVLYGDHYPYGLSTSDINKAVSYNVNEKNNVDKTPFVIYNTQLTSESFSQYTSYMNILPTIANLFDLDYDPRLYMGEDILSSDYINSYKNRVILADGSWENSIASYNATTGKITYYSDTTYTNEEIIAYNKEISNMIKMSNLAITSNYFKYLNEGLTKYYN
jgi:phosphoglycerol transferase MdoB-like AlkP superfamily enzyme